jgi:taurine dioxygenase
MSIDIEPLEGGVGAEVTGLDLSKPIDEETRKALNDAWLDAGILLFRGIGTSSERQLALSRCFGELEVHPIESIRLEGNDEIINLSNKGERQQMLHYFAGEAIAGRIPWHTDLIYTPTPNRGALLRMVEKPERGGETGWIDTAAAYDALPESMKERIQWLEARFDFVSDICDMRFGKPEHLEHGDLGSVEYPEFPDVAHPLVWIHPLSGRKSLSLSTIHLIDMVGMDRDTGDPILEALVEHTLDGRFTYVHDWEEGDMVLWDNWRTMHTAFGAPPGEVRVVHRTTIKGEVQMGRLL